MNDTTVIYTVCTLKRAQISKESENFYIIRDQQLDLLKSDTFSLKSDGGAIKDHFERVSGKYVNILFVRVSLIVLPIKIYSTEIVFHTTKKRLFHSVF